MNAAEKQRLEAIACRIRMGVIEGTYAAKCGHPGGSLSAADLMTYLYFCEMDVRPDEPEWSERDRFVLSKGHAAPVLYAALAERGFFPREDLKTLRQIGSHLQGHPALGKTPGVDMSTGSLGQGVSAAVGMALGGKLGRRDYRVYTLLGDGEIAEGECWEAMMSAAHYKLDNLVIIVDFNGLQIDGRVTDVMNPQPLDEKMRAFGLFTQVIDGHNFDEIENGKTREEPSERNNNEYGQGSRRELHGGQGGVARQGDEHRAVRAGDERASRKAESDKWGGALRWRRRRRLPATDTARRSPSWDTSTRT